MIGLKTKIKRKEGFADTEVDGNKVLMSVESGKYYGLNQVGTDIWAKIEEKVSVSELIDKLLGEYDIDKKSCEEQVLRYLNHLNDNDLIEVFSE